MITKDNCFIVYCAIVLIAFSVTMLIKYLRWRHRRQKMRLLELLGTKLCETCHNEVAEFSHPSDHEAIRVYCYDCLLIVQDINRDARRVHTQIEDDLASLWAQMAVDAVQSLGNSLTSYKKRSVRTKRRKRP